MILPLVLLVALAPEPCPLGDLACTAAERARAAKAATDPRERARALLGEARAHLGLFRQTGERAELCKAQRLIPRKHTEQLGDVPRTTRAEVKAELARLGHDCKPRAQRPTPTPTAVTPSPASDPPASVTPASAINGEPLEAIVASPAAEGTRGDALLDVDRHRARVARPVEGHAADMRAHGAATLPKPETVLTTPPTLDRPGALHPGRGLLLAGGLGLATASVLGGVATYAAVRVDRATSTYGGLAETANGQGYTTPDADMMRRELETDGPHWRRVRIGTAITAGLVAGAAVALITAGAVKRRRSLGRLSVHSLAPGLLMTARF